MNPEKKTIPISFLSMLVLAMLVNILGQAIHETGHSSVYQLMGRGPVWGFTKLVQVWDTPPIHPEEWVETRFEGDSGWYRLTTPRESTLEKIISTAAGPIAGLLAAAAGLVIRKHNKTHPAGVVGLMLTLSISLAAILYYLRSASRVGGDEFELAMLMGISTTPVNLFFGIGFATCFLLALRVLPAWKTRLTWLGATFLGSIITGGAMFFADNIVITQVDAGNPWFRPVLGFAFPVFVVYVLTVIGVMFWLKYYQNMIHQEGH